MTNESGLNGHGARKKIWNCKKNLRCEAKKYPKSGIVIFCDFELFAGH